MNTDPVPYEYEQLSLQLSENTTLEQWSIVGTQLYKGADVLTWALADWAAFGDKKWNALKTFCEAHGLSYTTVKEAATVAAAVPRERRNNQLLFGHHFEVSGLPPKEQDKWLKAADEKKLSVLDLRKAIREYQGKQSALLSDGEPLRQLTKPALDLYHVLTHQSDDYWTDRAKVYWRQKLDPIVQWYNEHLV